MEESLKNKKADFPIKFPIGPDPLSSEKLKAILAADLSDWRIITSQLPEDPTITKNELYREFLFEDFDNVIQFITEVAIACNIFPHHPKWVNTWTTLRVYLSTWDILHMISYKDIMLARYMENTYIKYSNFAANFNIKSRTNKNKENFISIIEKLIQNAEIEGIVENLNSYIKLNPELENKSEYSIILGEYNSYLKDFISGNVERKELKIEINQINSRLLKLLKTF